MVFHYGFTFIFKKKEQAQKPKVQGESNKLGKQFSCEKVCRAEKTRGAVCFC